MASISAYYKSSWLVTRRLIVSSDLFNRMLIISGWPAVLLTDAKSTVKNAGPVSTYYTTSADFISNERFFPRFYRTKVKSKNSKNVVNCMTAKRHNETDVKDAGFQIIKEISFWLCKVVRFFVKQKSDELISWQRERWQRCNVYLRNVFLQDNLQIKDSSYKRTW